MKSKWKKTPRLCKELRIQKAIVNPTGWNSWAFQVYLRVVTRVKSKSRLSSEFEALMLALVETPGASRNLQSGNAYTGHRSFFHCLAIKAQGLERSPLWISGDQSEDDAFWVTTLLIPFTSEFEVNNGNNHGDEGHQNTQDHSHIFQPHHVQLEKWIWRRDWREMQKLGGSQQGKEGWL